MHWRKLFPDEGDLLWRRIFKETRELQIAGLQDNLKSSSRKVYRVIDQLMQAAIGLEELCLLDISKTDAGLIPLDELQGWPDYENLSDLYLDSLEGSGDCSLNLIRKATSTLVTLGLTSVFVVEPGNWSNVLIKLRSDSAFPVPKSSSLDYCDADSNFSVQAEEYLRRETDVEPFGEAKRAHELSKEGE